MKPRQPPREGGQGANSSSEGDSEEDEGASISSVWLFSRFFRSAGRFSW